MNSIIPFAIAKYTPFGNGVIVTYVRHDFSLDLYSLVDNPISDTPVVSFEGHSNTVTSAEWRIHDLTGVREFQLISWSKKDQSLRFWSIDTDHMTSCGCKSSPHPKRPRSQSLKSSDKTNRYRTLNLEQELRILNNKNLIPGVVFDKINVKERYLIATTQEGKHLVQTKVTFPSLYPNEAPPSFTILSVISTLSKAKIKNVLVSEAQKCVEKHDNCMKPCFTALVQFLKQNQTVTSPLREGTLLTRTSSNPKKTFPPGFTEHIVSGIDTINSIALTYNMSTQELRTLNKIQHSQELYPGQVLMVKIKSLAISQVQKAEHKIASEATSPVISSPSVSDEHSLSKRVRKGRSMSIKEKNTGTKFPGLQIVAQSRVIKAHVKFVETAPLTKYFIDGLLTVTTSLFIFEPSLKEPRVQQFGVIKYQVFLEVSKISLCEMVEPTDLSVPSGIVYLQVLCIEKIADLDTNILKFTGDHQIIKGLVKDMEQWISVNQTKHIVESLNIDYSMPMTRSDLTSSTPVTKQVEIDFESPSVNSHFSPLSLSLSLL
eukprot:TRINITY_DN7993_c0_g2_i1.p1 TRINITY_DN7993_c0_g2~~TRINITY_DN7993_c0_g2_i1.p1  ORF type:complete len:544 (+),score=61.34 TRINITY_DN7993_c0_g2_i1:755-2386(+)